MKLQKGFWVLTLFSLSILSSCSKKNDPAPDTLLKGSISAKIDGVETTFQGATLKAAGTDGTVILSTGASNDKAIVFGVFASSITAGNTYNAAANDEDPGAFIGYLTKAQAESGSETGYVSTYAGTNGSVTITAITNDNVQGTFKGTLRFQENGTITTRSISVTEGKFNLAITNVNDIPGINGMAAHH